MYLFTVASLSFIRYFEHFIISEISGDKIRFDDKININSFFESVCVKSRRISSCYFEDSDGTGNIASARSFAVPIVTTKLPASPFNERMDSLFEIRFHINLAYPTYLTVNTVRRVRVRQLFTAAIALARLYIRDAVCAV